MSYKGRSVFMKILASLAVAFLRVIYFFLKLFPAKNKILYLSRQANTPSIDFVMLSEKINEIDPSLKQVMITRRMERNFVAALKGIWVTFPQMYHLATSKVCITDGYSIPVSVLKHKKDLTVFQIWHSLLAVKNFGRCAFMSDKKIALLKTLKMHENYDFVTCASEPMIDAFSKAFGTEKEKFLEIGLPRIDYILKNRQEISRKIKIEYPQIAGKQVILYAPTFRDYNEYKIDEIINSKPKDALLIVKLHPNMKCRFSDKENVLSIKKFSALELLCVADRVITDYSGFIAEAAAIEVPTYIYAYDYDKYRDTTGINIDLKEELKGFVFEDADKLFESNAFINPDIHVLRLFKEKYVPNFDGTATEKLAQTIIDVFK